MNYYLAINTSNEDADLELHVFGHDGQEIPGAGAGARFANMGGGWHVYWSPIDKAWAWLQFIDVNPAPRLVLCHGLNGADYLPRP